MKTNLLDWLRTHDLINISKLEREACVPERAIRRALLGKDKLPEKHFAAIEKVLKNYGYKS